MKCRVDVMDHHEFRLHVCSDPTDGENAKLGVRQYMSRPHKRSRGVHQQTNQLPQFLAPVEGRVCKEGWKMI